ncbi:hypothetical protein LB505_010943 [Fusarium chuoi]|nr:hypothetical protein LB505_010943 [Fusarium chuoi]
MYSAQQPSADNATINPAALSSPVIGLTQQPQRTLKRSHSPGVYGAPQLGDDGMSAISTPPLLYSFRHPTTLRQIRRSITIPF